MDKLVLLIAKKLNVHKAKVYTALHQIRMIQKKELPDTHWELTEFGKKHFKEGLLDIFLDLINDQIQDIELGPDLGLKSRPYKKICANCNKLKTSDYFGVSDRYEDGLTKWCLPCLFSFNESQHYGKV
jgi:hypothetical protein